MTQTAFDRDFDLPIPGQRMTARQVAEYLRVDVTTVYNYMNQAGGLKNVRLGTGKRSPRLTSDQWLADWLRRNNAHVRI